MVNALQSQLASQMAPVGSVVAHPGRPDTSTLSSHRRSPSVIVPFMVGVLKVLQRHLRHVVAEVFQALHGARDAFRVVLLAGHQPCGGSSVLGDLNHLAVCGALGQLAQPRFGIEGDRRAPRPDPRSMKEYTVEMTEAAETAIYNHARYIAVEKQEPQNAMRWPVAVRTLKTMPKRCTLAEENDDVDYEVRQLPVGSPALLLTVDDDRRTVLVVTFRGEGQLPRLGGLPPNLDTLRDQDEGSVHDECAMTLTERTDASRAA